MKKILFIFCINVITSFSWAISETNYEENFKNIVLPYFYQNSIEVKFKGTNDLNLYSRISVNNPGSKCIVILPGRSESVIKYAEFFYDLKTSLDTNEINANIFILDHRGQGLSQRELTNTEVGYVKKFNDYVNDVNLFVENIVKPYRCRGITLIAHSMGAGIGLSYMLQFPDTFDAAAISSPMLKIQTKPYHYLVAKTIVRTQVLLGKGKDFTIGQTGYDSTLDFENNKFTKSKARYAMTMKLYEQFPETKLGGPSNNWIYEIMKGTSKIRTNYKQFNIPMLVFTAGMELYSEPSEMKALCEQALNCKHTHFPDSKHEIFNDSDKTRNNAIEQIVNLVK